MGTKHRVSLGLPVYNGEKYLEAALRALLAQTFSDFELILSDNASTDRTADICREFALRDERIVYHRNTSNIGAIPNFNLAFSKATGEMFRWVTYDDISLPTSLERCVAVLDEHPDAVLCHTRTVLIDETGDAVAPYDDFLDFRSSDPCRRFKEYLFRPAVLCNAIMGLVRADELRKTPLLGSFLASDKILLGELVLRGELYRVDEYLFLRRLHAGKSDRANRSRRALAAWLNPATAGRIQLPTTIPRDFVELEMAIRRSPTSFRQKMLCRAYLLRWLAMRPYWSIRRRLSEPGSWGGGRTGGRTVRPTGTSEKAIRPN